MRVKTLHIDCLKLEQVENYVGTSMCWVHDVSLFLLQVWNDISDHMSGFVISN